MFIMRKNEEADTEYTVDLCTEILKVNLCEVFYLELHARRNKDLLHVSVSVEHAEAFLDTVDLLRVFAL